MSQKKKRDNKRFTLDTSAILTLYYDEVGADDVEYIFAASKGLKAEAYVPFMTIMELLYLNMIREGREEAKKFYSHLKTLPIKIVGLSEEILNKAAELKANHHISVADSWIAATAIIQDATLVHKDPELIGLKEILDMKVLPLKN